MDAIEKLKLEAREQRDAAILQAKRDYKQTLAVINEAAKRLQYDAARRKLRHRRAKNPEDGPLAGFSAAGAAEFVLREQGPLTVPEIAAMIQGLGCHPKSSPRSIMENLRTSMKKHSGRFVRGEDGKWSATTLPASQ